MKKFIELAIIIAIMTAAMPSCNSMESKQGDETKTINRYNICLVLDGTDCLTNENGVPQISSSEVVELAKMLANKGVGNLYLSYVDANCDNNKVAIFDWHKKRPIELEAKPGYMKMSEYREITKQYQKDSLSYSSSLVDAIGTLSRDCERICNIAYSDEVAKQKNGSALSKSHLRKSLPIVLTKMIKERDFYIQCCKDAMDAVNLQNN